MAIRILHIISSLNRGGRERQLANIAAFSNISTFQTKIVYFNKWENSYIEEYSLNDITIKVKSTGKICRLREIYNILKYENPDVVYTWGNAESISIMLLKPFCHYRFINGSLRHGVRLNRFSHYFRTIILHLSKYIVANSKAGLQANNLKKGIVLYNGIDKKFLEPVIRKEEKRKYLTDISLQIPLIISVANLVPYKDYFSVINALRRLKDENYNFYYLILGNGSMKKEIEKSIHNYDLTKHIRIVGSVDNVEDYLKVSDIFIHSSKGEGCSNAILEAMAAGLPVLASNTGGTPEIITSENGLLFEYKNDIQLAELIKYLLNNKDRSIQMGKKSRELILERFTMDKMMKNYYDIINELARG